VRIPGHGKTPKAYYLKRKGWELLRRASDIPEELIGAFVEAHREETWSPQMYHRLRLLDLLIALEVQVRGRPQLNLVKTLLEYRRVKRQGRIARETTDFVVAEEIPENRIIPDAAFVLENVETERRGLFFIEMDMATERILTHNWLRVSSGRQNRLKAAAKPDFQLLSPDRVKSSFLEGWNGWKPPWVSDSHAIGARIV